VFFLPSTPFQLYPYYFFLYVITDTEAPAFSDLDAFRSRYRDELPGTFPLSPRVPRPSKARSSCAGVLSGGPLFLLVFFRLFVPCIPRWVQPKIFFSPMKPLIFGEALVFAPQCCFSDRAFRGSFSRLLLPSPKVQRGNVSLKMSSPPPPSCAGLKAVVPPPSFPRSFYCPGVAPECVSARVTECAAFCPFPFFSLPD